MPPKAAAPPEKKTMLLGRPGSSTSLMMGIVGMPNVGKSTFFNVLTSSSIPAENRPFCTIEPNVARVAVPDPRYDWLVSLYHPASRDARAHLEVKDIAGLVRGASEGKELGNAFLSHIASVDGLYMMARAFDEPEVTHVEGDVDPVRDLDIIAEELRAKDLEWAVSRADKLAVMVTRGGAKEKKKEYETLLKVAEVLRDRKLFVRCADWTSEEVTILNSHNFITAKSMVFLANLSPEDYARKRNKWLPRIKAWIDATVPGDPLVPFSAQFELQWAAMSPEERAAAAAGPEGASTALPRIIKAGFAALKLQVFFTAGADEVKAWIIRQGDLAPQAAGKIHSDMERGFICAEVMPYEALHEAGSEAAVKASGKYVQKGRTYEVEDGDICLFKFNPAGGKKK